MNFKILIYGCGQIGSRHLQSLANVDFPLSITVYDSSIEALARARTRWDDALVSSLNPIRHDIIFINTFQDVCKKIDLAIIATSADVRVASVECISKLVKVKYWILEKVLAQSIDDLNKLNILLGNSYAWVNTPMRSWSLYENLKWQLNKNSVLDIQCDGIQGLACNAIHYIDLISYLSDSDPKSIDVAGLRLDWHPAKRTGFYEVSGNLVVKFTNGSILSMSSMDRSSGDKVMKIACGNKVWGVDECGKSAVSNMCESVYGECELQSQLTSKIVSQIRNSGGCSLTTLSNSVLQHEVLLDGLLKHWNSHTRTLTTTLPIT